MNDESRVEVFQVRDFETSRIDKSDAWQPLLERPGLLVGVYRVTAGQSDQDTHSTHDRDEVYYVIRGKGNLDIEGAPHALSRGTVVYVKSGTAHYFHKVTEDLVLLVFFAG